MFEMDPSRLDQGQNSDSRKSALADKKKTARMTCLG